MTPVSGEYRLSPAMKYELGSAPWSSKSRAISTALYFTAEVGSRVKQRYRRGSQNGTVVAVGSTMNLSPATEYEPFGPPFARALSGSLARIRRTSSMLPQTTAV